MAVLLFILVPLLVVVLGAIVIRLARRAKSSGSSPCFLLVAGDEGLEMVKARRDLASGGIMARGVLFPDELIDNLGYNTFALADEVRMPADGNISHLGDHPDLKPVSQAKWVAEWSQYHSARVRLNWAAIFQRGDGNLSMLRNIGLAVVVLVNIYMGIAVWGLRSETGNLQASNVVISGQLARLTGVGNTVVPGVVNNADHSLVPPVPTVSPTVGPAGDPSRRP